jgi:hypothetical protein
MTVNAAAIRESSEVLNAASDAFQSSVAHLDAVLKHSAFGLSVWVGAKQEDVARGLLRVGYQQFPSGWHLAVQVSGKDSESACTVLSAKRAIRVMAVPYFSAVVDALHVIATDLAQDLDAATPVVVSLAMQLEKGAIS